MGQRRSARVLAWSQLLRAGGVATAGVLLLLALPWPVRAQTAPPPDSACKLCHVDLEGQAVLPSGEVLTLTVAMEPLLGSVHGPHAASDVFCTDCHRDRERYLYPHQPNPAQNRQEYRADVAGSCEGCHTPAASHNPGHLQAQETSGLPNCIDCHGGHAIEDTESMTADPVGTCQGCHSSYEDAHVEEVHAEIAANFEPDQTCESCHSDRPLSSDAQCKTCHSLLSSQLLLPSGDTVDLHVHADDIVNSVHGERMIGDTRYTALQCTDCHQDQERYGFPHPSIDADSHRELTLAMEAICQNCHGDIYERQRDGIHGHALAEGNLDAATCFDCHGNHAIQDPDEPRAHVSQTCAQCHSTINEAYAQSVHGAVLLGEDNPDVPVCTDCHGVHDISDPMTTQFRLASPELCGGCHADEAMMAKYELSTEVFDTYVADFHGSTVQLFEQQSPDQETNKAVCYDCHGVHNILPANDEHSQVIKDNLLITCRQCHPDATASFPDTWTSHFRPSLEHNPLVYLINLFYAVLIPAVIGGFLLFIGTDVWRGLRTRRHGRKDRL